MSGIGKLLTFDIKSQYYDSNHKLITQAVIPEGVRFYINIFIGLMWLILIVELLPLFAFIVEALKFW